MTHTLQITKTELGIKLICHPAIAATIHYSLEQLHIQYTKGSNKAPISKKKYLGRKDDQEMLDSYKLELCGERMQHIEAIQKQLPIGQEGKLTLSLEMADELLAMLNDRRMNLAEEHEISEEDMEACITSLKTIKSRTMAEIGMLAVLQAHIISALTE